VIPICSVTVLEDRASVTRRGSLAVAAGQQRLVVDRVSPVIADKTLTVTATGARVLDARIERYVAPWRMDEDTSSTAPDDPVSLRAHRRTLDGKRADAESRADAARNESAALAQAIGAAWRDLATSAARGVAPPDGAAAAIRELDAQDRAARALCVDAELEVSTTTAALARLDARIARAEARAGTDAARLVIDVVADAAGDATIACSYVVPGAAWRPYHRAVLADDTIAWETSACVWQATGEDWTDCELVFSLERASLGVEPPDLRDDELRTRRRPDTVTVEAREQEVQTTGLGGATQVPGIDDGGLGLVLRGERAVTIAADGAPHRVPIGGFSSPAELALVAIPPRSPWVHVRARLANTGSVPVLAGPVDLIMASGYVGRAEVDFVAAGEKLELGFGPEADVRAHRTETRTRDDAGLLGGWNVQTVRVAVRLSNLGATKRDVLVTERVPVSEVEQVEIETAGAEAYLLADEAQVTPRAIDDRGLVSWTVELPPFGRRAVALEYKIKSQRNVAGV
jgi:uncharacterized protein (TIGR02231 family)